MAQWQYPLQTGFQVVQQQPQFSQQQQQQPPAHYLQQQPQPQSQFIQPQNTAAPPRFQPLGQFQQQPPPVPALPQQFQQQQPQQQPAFLNFPPPQQQQPSRFLNASPGGPLLPQPTGFMPRHQQQQPRPLVPQMTGYVDPRLQMMSQVFMPIGGGPGDAALQLAPQPPSQNLVQSIQQHNQSSRGTATQQLSWALTKAEKKNYNDIFRSWDAMSTGFITGQKALEVFAASGLDKNDLARIWSLADRDDRGKLNIAEFHVAMGLIYRRLNGMPIPDELPEELVPPSARDLGSSVDIIKDILKHETRSRSPSNLDAPISRLKNRSFNNASPSLDGNRDATIYKHADTEPPAGGFYKPRSRHVDRDAIRSKDEENSTAADLSDMKRQLANTAQMLDQAATVSKEDEELENEMEDLKYRVKRLQDDLDYVSRGPRSSAKEEEKRRLERQLLSLMHERIPEVERKIKARDERKEREKRQWVRDRDRANERFGRFDPKDDYLDTSYSRLDERPYSRGDNRDRPYSRGDDRDRPYSRGGGDDRDRFYSDRDRPYSRNNYDSYRRERSPSRDKGHDQRRSPPPQQSQSNILPPSPSTAAAPPASTLTPAPNNSGSQTPNLKNMTPAERQAFARAEAQRRIQNRMAALGVTAPPSASSPGTSGAPAIDTSVEDRLAEEKKEAEAKARFAEKEREERERARKERLENERAVINPPVPALTAKAKVPPPLQPTPTTATKKPAAPPPPTSKPRAPAPPPPRKSVAPPPPKAAVAATTASRSVVPRPPKPSAPSSVAAPEPEVDGFAKKEEEALRAREMLLQKQRQEREQRFQEKMRQLEKEEEEAAREEEEKYQKRLEAAKERTRNAKALVAEAHAAPTALAPSLAPVSVTPSIGVEKSSTNPFSKLIKEGASPVTQNGGPGTAASANPWAESNPAPVLPPPSKSPAPVPSKSSYQTAPPRGLGVKTPSFDDGDDWEDIKEKGGSGDSDDDSSDDEITQSRSVRANIAQQLFGSLLPARPASAAASSGISNSNPSSPTPVSAASVPPAPAPPAPPAPPQTKIATPSNGEGPPAGDVSALLHSIQGGMKLRPTKTVDKSVPPLSGRVLGDSAPPAHIAEEDHEHIAPPPTQQFTLPETTPMLRDSNMSRSSTSTSHNRQSVSWFADRAANAGAAPANGNASGGGLGLPEDEQDEDEEDVYFQTPSAIVPQILVDEHQERVREPTPMMLSTKEEEHAGGLMDDIDTTIQHRVRSLYPYEGDDLDYLSFKQNVVIVANPSKSGEDWWFGTVVSSGKKGLFPKTYIEVITPKKATTLYDYFAANPDELGFNAGETLSIVDAPGPEDPEGGEWWKVEKGGIVFIVPSAYLELVEG